MPSFHFEISLYIEKCNWTEACTTFALGVLIMEVRKYVKEWLKRKQEKNMGNTVGDKEAEGLSWWHRASGSLGHERKTAVCHLVWHFTLTLNEMSRSINDPILASWNERDPSLPSIAVLRPSYFPPSYRPPSHIKAQTATQPCWFRGIVRHFGEHTYLLSWVRREDQYYSHICTLNMKLKAKNG